MVPRPLLDRLHGAGRTLVGVQIREGDYWQYADCNWAFVAPTRWYLDWLDTVRDGLDQPVLLLCSDEPDRVRDDFARYRPFTAADLGPSACRELADAGYGFFADFYLLGHCDLLGVTASSFALVPAMLNERCRQFVRPHADAGRLVPFDPWDTDVYADADAVADERTFATLRGRLRYRWRNLRLMGAAHGYRQLLRRTLPRLHRRVAYELGAWLIDGLLVAMRSVNRLLRRRFGRTLSPLDVFRSDRLIRFFTAKFNR